MNDTDISGANLDRAWFQNLRANTVSADHRFKL